MLAIPVAVLTGHGLRGADRGVLGDPEDAEKFNALFRFVITPLFLFSGTFFPVRRCRSVLQPVAWLTPL